MGIKAPNRLLGLLTAVGFAGIAAGLGTGIVMNKPEQKSEDFTSIEEARNRVNPFLTSILSYTTDQCRKAVSRESCGCTIKGTTVSCRFDTPEFMRSRFSVQPLGEIKKKDGGGWSATQTEAFGFLGSAKNDNENRSFRARSITIGDNTFCEVSTFSDNHTESRSLTHPGFCLEIANAMEETRRQIDNL